MSRIIYACGCEEGDCLCGPWPLSGPWAVSDVGEICPTCHQPVTAYDLDELLRAKEERVAELGVVLEANRKAQAALEFMAQLQLEDAYRAVREVVRLTGAATEDDIEDLRALLFATPTDSKET